MGHLRKQGLSGKHLVKVEQVSVLQSFTELMMYIGGWKAHSSKLPFPSTSYGNGLLRNPLCKPSIWSTPLILLKS